MFYKSLKCFVVEFDKRFYGRKCNYKYQSRLKGAGGSSTWLKSKSSLLLFLTEGSVS